MKKIKLLLLLAGACASGFVLGYFYFNSRQEEAVADTIPTNTEGSSTNQDAPGQVIRGGDSERFNEVVLDLKQEYFDDLYALWGRGTESGEFIGEGFDSEYVARSAPRPINHPIEIKQEMIAIKPVNRSEIKLDPLSANDPLSEASRAVDENYKDYGELIGGFFSNWGQTINLIEEADVDKDGIPEKLITTSDTGSNHPPHHGFVVQDNVIIASVEFVSGFIKPAKDSNGFYVKDPKPVGKWGAGMSYLSPLCCPIGYRIYRVVYEDGRFAPVWEQDISYIQFKKSE